MAVYRVDVLIEDPDDLLQWVDDNVDEDQVVRCLARKTLIGWVVKAVFKRQSDAELFHSVWIPQAASHEVPAWHLSWPGTKK